MLDYFFKVSYIFLSLKLKGYLEKKNLSLLMARWGGFLLIIYILIALLTPFFSGLGVIPNGEFGLDTPIYSPPSLDHWCGTDRLGRDVCVRTLEGSGIALKVVFLAVTLALVLGVPLGILSGYLGGMLDRILVLLMDTLYTVPVLLLSAFAVSLASCGGAARSAARHALAR